MKILPILCFVACAAVCSSASARGGAHSTSGGAFGTSAAAPGTNSAGTALASDGTGGHVMPGPLLGTDAATDAEERRLDKLLEGSICRGC